MNWHFWRLISHLFVFGVMQEEVLGESWRGKRREIPFCCPFFYHAPLEIGDVA